jgi:hypothetical protein
VSLGTVSVAGNVIVTSAAGDSLQAAKAWGLRKNIISKVGNTYRYRACFMDSISGELLKDTALRVDSPRCLVKEQKRDRSLVGCMTLSGFFYSGLR